MPSYDYQQDTQASQARGGYYADAAIPISDVIRSEGQLKSDRIAMEVMERLRICTHETWVDRSKIWVRNLLYLHGEQHIKWNEYGRRWLRKSPARERRFTTNFLLGMLHHQAAKMVQSRPDIKAYPENTDLDKRRGAKLSERLLHADWQDLKLGNARYLATLDCLTLGMGFLEVGFNPRGGELVTIYDEERFEDGSPVLDSMGTPLRKIRGGEPVVLGFRWTGGLFCRPRSPFSVFVPPSVENPSLDDSPYLITTDWMSEQEIRLTLKLPKSFKFGPPDPEFEHVEPVTSFLQRFATSRGIHPRIRSGQHLLVKYQERRTDVPGHQHGKTYYVINNKMVHEDRGQLDDGRYQLFEFPWKSRRGQFWPQAFLTDLIEPQARVNQGTSHAYTWMSLLSNPNILVPRGSGIPQTIAFNFRRYDYNPSSGPPTFWSPPPPSQAIFALLDRTASDMSKVASQSPFSRGEPVPGVPAAKHTQLMQDADAQEMGPIVQYHASSFGSMGECIIDLHRKYDPDERTIRTIGRSHRPELLSIKKTDLPARSRLHVMEGSLFSVMPSTRIDQLEKLSMSGFFGAFADVPNVRKKLLDWVRMPDLLEVDGPDDILNSFLENINARVIEEGMSATIPPWTERPLLEAIKGALLERCLADDSLYWDDKVMSRVMNWKTQLDTALAKLDVQAMEQQRQEQEDVFGLQARGEILKSQLRSREKVVAEAAKAGAGLLVSPSPTPAGGGGQRSGQKSRRPSSR